MSLALAVVLAAVKLGLPLALVKYRLGCCLVIVMVLIVTLLTCYVCQGSILLLVVVVQPIPFSLNFF